MLKEIETTTEQDTALITISAPAAQAVQNIFADRKLEGYALRVYVAGGGCSGINFGMALDNNIHPNDISFQSQGVQLVVDDQSMAYLHGAKIDFVNDPVRGAGFIVDSPVKNSMGCSCGSSCQSSAEGGDGVGCASGSCGCSS